MMKRFLMFFILLIAITIPVIAQEVEPPTNWLDLFANINKWLGSLAGVAAVTVFLALAVNTFLKLTGFWKQLTAWVISTIILVAGNLVNMGFMADLNLFHTLIYGLAAGFVANGIFDIGLVQALLRALKILKD